MIINLFYFNIHIIVFIIKNKYIFILLIQIIYLPNKFKIHK